MILGAFIYLSLGALIDLFKALFKLNGNLVGPAIIHCIDMAMKCAAISIVWKAT